ncbi:MAG: NAD(+) synthase, partial [Lachnospiraceae bacterium]|nr:NAD(+) synthase [Lachnospiraceae bacterium]
MIEGFLRVAVATPKIKVADVRFNTDAVLREIAEADRQGVSLLVFPELVLTAYTCADLFHQTILIERAAAALDEVAEATRRTQLVAVVGVPYMVDHKLYNCAAVLHAGRILALVPKKNLPNYSEFYERRWFTPGQARVVTLPHRSATGEEYTIPFGMNILMEALDRPDFRLACEICEDVWVLDPPSTRHVLAGATVIANTSASDETVGKDSYRRELIRSTSARLVSVYCYANAGDGESTTDLVFGGQDIIAENGSVVTEGKRFDTGLYIADVDLQRITQERARMTTFPDIDDTLRDAYSIVKFRFAPAATRVAPETLAGQLAADAADLRRYVDPKPFVPSGAAERNARCDEIFTIQALGLKKRLEHTGCQSAVIGISGGLDSTLALLVIARAFDMLGLPRENIISVTMPAFGTTDRTYNNAVTLTRLLHATLREINIKAAVLQHFQDIGHDPEDHSVVYENAQARERTQILMDIANQSNGIVIGTGDLSELALGWATYNADHMSMYGVNAGVPKTLVRYLVKFVADTSKDADLACCLNDIFDTPVSPELLPPTGDGQISQKTEDLVGPYELHDFFLYQILRYGF